jgi:hypothetical protein
MRKILGVIAVIFAVALAGVAMSPAVLYLYGLRQIPDEVLAAPPQILPAAATAALWAHLGGTGAPRIERSNPYTLIWLFLKGGPLAASPEDQVAGLGSRALLRRVPDFPRDRRLIVSVSAGIWVGWHWTAEQALSAHLTESYFGHRFYGLEAAAQGYFGLPSAQLSLEQMAHLVIVPRSPSRFDPWCNPERNQAAARQAMSRLPQARPDAPIHLMAAPAGACSE